MKTIYSKKTIFTFLISTFVIVLALFGANWQSGFAETFPTIPGIYNFEPKEICANSNDTVVTVTGEDFIDDIDGYYYTWVRWLGPSDLLPSYIIPDDINDEETILKFTIETSKLTQVGWAYFWIVNHPESENPFELTGAFLIEIKGCNDIFLPLVVK